MFVYKLPAKVTSKLPKSMFIRHSNVLSPFPMYLYDEQSSSGLGTTRYIDGRTDGNCSFLHPPLSVRRIRKGKAELDRESTESTYTRNNNVSVPVASALLRYKTTVSYASGQNWFIGSDFNDRSNRRDRPNVVLMWSFLSNTRYNINLESRYNIHEWIWCNHPWWHPKQ